jgi:toxin FitB
MLLLDTVALSEAMKSRPNSEFAAWLRKQNPATVFISVITLGEIERGIEAQRVAAPDFARRLEVWKDNTIASFSERVLAVTVEIALTWGRLGQRRGHMNADLLIAATAIVHDLAVVTRNTRHFEGTGARVVNPFGP